MSYTKINSYDTEAFISVDETDGLKLIMPNKGAVSLDKTALQNFINFLHGYNVVMARQKGNANVSYFFINEDSNFVVFDVNPHMGINDRAPKCTIRTISSVNGSVISTAALPSVVVNSIEVQAAGVNIVPTVPVISEIKFVKNLPNETSAEKGVVYLFEDKYHLLNTEEDGFNILDITPLVRSQYPSTTLPGKEGIIYNLTNKQTNPITFEMGLYTYNGSTNKYTLLDKKLQNTDKLPAVENAKTTIIYVLTKDFGEGDEKKAKGTAWNVVEGKYVQVTTPIKNVTKLNCDEVAIDNAYYNVNGVLSVYNATSKKFNKIGDIKKVGTLPNVTTINIDPTVVYTLMANVDSTHLSGSKWIFDMETKAFVAYSEE